MTAALKTEPKTEDLGEEIALLATQIDAATYRLLCLIRDFDNQRAWVELDCLSCAQWLSWRLGWAPSTARDHLRVAHALAKLPELSAIIKTGQVTYSKARAVTRVATPETDTHWASIALEATAAQLENIVRRHRRADRAEEIARTNDHQKHRCLTAFYDDDGMLVIQARLAPEPGKTFMKALEATEQWDADDERTFPQRQADALVELAEGHDATGNSRTERCVVLHVDEEVLADPSAPGRCELEDGPAVSAETAQRLRCDGTVIKMTHGTQGQVLNVGRKTHVVSTALRRALRHRDETCRFPGCCNRIVDLHHIIHRIHGGETDLGNLIQVCRRHHVLLHEGRYRIEGDADRTLTFFRANGARIPNVVPPPRVAQGDQAGVALCNANKRAGIHVDSNTAYPRWDGVPVDYEHVAVVMQQFHRLAQE